MRRFLAMATVGALAATSALASDLDRLKGRYGFNWFSDPEKAKSAEF